MYVQVKYRLAGARPYIQHGPVAVFDFSLTRNLRGCKMTAANDLRVRSLRLLQSGKVLLRDNQNVRRGLRPDIFEREYVFVFMDLPGRNVAADDAAEKTVRITHGSPGEAMDFTWRSYQSVFEADEL
jgi:hypothetical protein